LAERFGCAESELPSLVHRGRAAHWSAARIKYIYAPEFDHPEAQRLIFTDTPDCAVAADCVDPPPDLPAYLRDLYRTPLLTAAQERDLFRRMNFLLHRAELARRLLDPSDASTDALDHIEALIQQAVEFKNRIIQANLR